MIGKNDFTFPFDTCEIPTNHYFAQPYSVAVNTISVVTVLYFLCKTKTTHAFLLLFALLLFDISHTFSHFVHIKSKLQVTIVHVLAYLLNFAFFYALYKHSRKVPTLPLLLFLGAVLSFDIYAFFHLSLLYYLLTQIVFFFSIFCYYYGALQKGMQKRLNLLLLFIGLVYLGFVNEAFNCKSMLARFPRFPFHAIIELIILFAVYYFCLTFYKI